MRNCRNGLKVAVPLLELKIKAGESLNTFLMQYSCATHLSGFQALMVIIPPYRVLLYKFPGISRSTCMALSNC
jgi:hypothetical protein